MRNLISANFNRLFKSHLFWILAAATLIYSAWATYDGAKKLVADAEHYFSAVSERFCFDHGPVVLMILPVFISLYIGTEFSDGTMRNKITVGNRRGKIYLADFLAAAGGSLVICAAWHIGALSALPVLGVWEIGIAGWLLSVIKSMLFCAAFSAVLCLVSHIVTNKAAVAIIEIMLALAMILAGSLLYNLLMEPETVSSGVEIIADDDGNTVMKPISPHPNADYIAEPGRTACKRVLNALPSGQAILLANIADSDVEQLDMQAYSFCASACIIAACTALGAAAFGRKDLK